MWANTYLMVRAETWRSRTGVLRGLNLGQTVRVGGLRLENSHTAIDGMVSNLKLLLDAHIAYLCESSGEKQRQLKSEREFRLNTLTVDERRMAAMFINSLAAFLERC
jgi:hypothetical protein